MKTNEFTNLDEGFKDQLLNLAGRAGAASWDWLAKTGVRGRTAADIEMTKQSQKHTLEIGFASWATRAQQAFYGALNAGAITLTEHDNINMKKLTFEKFDLLLESMINEDAAHNAANWIKEYVKQFMVNYVKPPNYDTVIDNLANQFQQAIEMQYKKNPKVQYNFNDTKKPLASAPGSITPIKSSSGPVRTIYEYIYGIGLLQQRDKEGRLANRTSPTGSSAPSSAPATTSWPPLPTESPPAASSPTAESVKRSNKKV